MRCQTNGRLIAPLRRTFCTHIYNLPSNIYRLIALRAKRSNPYPRMNAQIRTVDTDCFVAKAPRNDRSIFVQVTPETAYSRTHGRSCPPQRTSILWRIYPHAGRCGHRPLREMNRQRCVGNAYMRSVPAHFRRDRRGATCRPDFTVLCRTNGRPMAAPTPHLLHAYLQSTI